MSLSTRIARRVILAEKGRYPFKNYRHARGGSVLFVGCNVASLYPRTVAAVRGIFEERLGVGCAFDCCGSPLRLEGFDARALRVRDGVVGRLRARGAREVIALCPNCASMFSDVPDLRVTSVYAKLRELGVGRVLDPNGAVFVPCPDRAQRTWLVDVLACFGGAPPVLDRAPCCGLGRGSLQDPDRSRRMARRCLEQARAAADGPLYVYCASCAGQFVSCGEAGVRYVLAELLGTGEGPDVGSSLANRARATFL